MNNKAELGFHLVMLLLIFVASISICVLFEKIYREMNTLESGIITDKYESWDNKLFGAKHYYHFEINNSTIVNVDRHIYRQYNINETYEYALRDVEK